MESKLDKLIKEIQNVSEANDNEYVMFDCEVFIGLGDDYLDFFNDVKKIANEATRKGFNISVAQYGGEGFSLVFNNEILGTNKPRKLNFYINNSSEKYDVQRVKLPKSYTPIISTVMFALEKAYKEHAKDAVNYVLNGSQKTPRKKI